MNEINPRHLTFRISSGELSSVSFSRLSRCPLLITGNSHPNRIQFMHKMFECNLVVLVKSNHLFSIHNNTAEVQEINERAHSIRGFISCLRSHRTYNDMITLRLCSPIMLLIGAVNSASSHQCVICFFFRLSETLSTPTLARKWEIIYRRNTPSLPPPQKYFL